MTVAPHGGDRLVGGRYALEALIGRGGMGEVWRARHVTLTTEVAIKFLQTAESETARQRFLTEAQVTANLKTRHAVQVFDFGVTDDGQPYLVMELLLGETLERRIAREGRLAVGTTATVLHKAASALARAHALGIVHRDFKPENIMLVPDEEEDDGEAVKVVDFGVAKLVGGLDDSLKSALACLSLARSGRAPARFSMTSSAVGTPYYMAPEQVLGEVHVGPAADIWAFGVVAYECLTGRRPFGGETVSDLLGRIIEAVPARRPSSLAPLPPAFDAWFTVACAREPGDRFCDVHTAAAELVTALVHGGGLTLGKPSSTPHTPGARDDRARVSDAGASERASRDESPLAESIAPPGAPMSAAGSAVHDETRPSVPRAPALPSLPELRSDSAWTARRTGADAAADGDDASPATRARARASLAVRSLATVAAAASLAAIAIAVAAREAPEKPEQTLALGAPSPPAQEAPAAVDPQTIPGDGARSAPPEAPAKAKPPPEEHAPTPEPAPSAAPAAPPHRPGAMPHGTAYRLPPLGF